MRAGAMSSSLPPRPNSGAVERGHSARYRNLALANSISQKPHGGPRCVGSDEVAIGAAMSRRDYRNPRGRSRRRLGRATLRWPQFAAR